MASMSTPYELSGRTMQKARTRAAMLGAARELLSEGTTPTVEQAAERAGISRTTAYRYFPNQRALMVAIYPELDEPSLLGQDAPHGAEARMELVLDHIARQIVRHEPELRAMLRLSLETPAPPPEALPLRQGRVIGWLQDAFAPLRGHLTDAEIRRLALSVRAAFGIEALVWLTDVAGLSREEAVDLMRSSARALLRASQAGG